MSGINISNGLIEVSERKQFTESDMALYIGRYEAKGWIVQSEIFGTADPSYPQKYHYQIVRVEVKKSDVIASYRIKEVA